MVLIVTFNSFEDETQGIKGTEVGDWETFNSFEDETAFQSNAKNISTHTSFNSFEDETLQCC